MKAHCLCLLVLLCVTPPASPVHAQVAERRALSAADLQEVVPLVASWRYHPGDDPAWADPAFDDGDWEPADPHLLKGDLPAGGWPGIGWFRLHLDVDSTLWEVPLGLSLLQTGASEIYLNGRLVQRLGRVSGSPAEERPLQKLQPIPLPLARQSEQVLAIRYSNTAAARWHEAGHMAGFMLRLGALDAMLERSARETKRNTQFQMFFLGALFALGLLHLLLYGLYPAAKEHLFFALFGGSVGLFTVLLHELEAPTGIERHFVILHLWNAALLLITVYAQRFLHAVFHRKPPRHFYLFLAAGAGLLLWSWFDLMQAFFWVNVLCLLGLFEFVRLNLLALLRRERGAWIIGAGATVLTLGSVQGVLANLGLMDPYWNVTEVFQAGVGALLLAMSVHLSRSFAQTNHELKTQLNQVRQLSEKMMEQEIQRRLLEAENTRKTQELDEARALQLAMLPKQIPELSDFQIAVYMKTAAEVGGDYYDFNVAEDGTLTIAIGDATGHGAKAGTMVTAAKSLFITLAKETDLLLLLRKFTHALKAMQLERIYMALALVRIRDTHVAFTSAGMPPALLFRAATGQVEEYVLKGMPLGSFVDFPYRQVCFLLNPGDTLVLMSDGLPETFNEAGEMLGYDTVRTLFESTAGRSPEDVIEHLTTAGNAWSNGRGQADDITFVVIKRKAWVEEATAV